MAVAISITTNQSVVASVIAFAEFMFFTSAVFCLCLFLLVIPLFPRAGKNMFVPFFRKGVTAGGIHFFVLLISYFQEDQFS